MTLSTFHGAFLLFGQETKIHLNRDIQLNMIKSIKHPGKTSYENLQKVKAFFAIFYALIFFVSLWIKNMRLIHGTLKCLGGYLNDKDLIKNHV